VGKGVTAKQAGAQRPVVLHQRVRGTQVSEDWSVTESEDKEIAAGGDTATRGATADAGTNSALCQSGRRCARFWDVFLQPARSSTNSASVSKICTAFLRFPKHPNYSEQGVAIVNPADILSLIMSFPLAESILRPHILQSATETGGQKNMECGGKRSATPLWMVSQL